jgi:sulfite exporter TauE/SafE
MRFLAEAALLGLASGPACLLSCGPVLVPCLAARGEAFRGTARTLGVFLGGRLAGYLVFSVLAWAAGMAAPADRRAQTLLYGCVDLALAVMLLVYARGAARCAEPQPAAPPLVTIGDRAQAWTPATLGLLTGLNICPPFLAAAVRAAEARSLSAAAAFFLVFFLGTAIWSLPLAAAGWLRRTPAIGLVARITLVLLAGWYTYLGAIAIGWRFGHD